MRIKNFNLVIVLIAEILVALYGYLYHYTLPRLAITMGIVFIIFFIIGSILQSMSNRLFAEVEAREAEAREALEKQEAELAAVEIENRMAAEQKEVV